MKKVTYFLPLFFFVLTACPDSQNDLSEETEKTDLPDSFDKISIVMFDGGGMLPVSYKTYISNDSAYWSYDRYGFETYIKWIPENQELEQLYNDLKSQRFDRIKSDCEGEVYDRGGITLQITVDGKEYEIDNSGNCFVQKKWSSNYSNTIRLIEEYKSKRLKDYILEIPIEVSENLLRTGYDINFSVNDAPYWNHAVKDTLTWKKMLYTGVNEFVIHMYYKDSVNSYGSPATFAYEQIFDTISAKTKKIVIDWKDEGVILKQEN